MSQQKIDDLLVEWELARQAGRVISAAELCESDQGLLAEVNQRIAKLKATAWMLEPDAAGAESDLPADTETLGEGEPTIAEFVDSLAASDVLSAASLLQLRQEYASAGSEDVATFSARLVREGLLTDYQAAVLLKRKDGPLLLDRYVILDTVGSGGMGVVFKALHRSMATPSCWIWGWLGSGSLNTAAMRTR